MMRCCLLDRLIGVGVGADGDGLALIGGGGQFALEQFRRARLGEQLRLEVEPRRQAHIGVRRPRETIDAAVLAAAIGVDRAVEGNIRRIVARDDRPRLFEDDFRAQRGRGVEPAPAVVLLDAARRLEPAGRIDSHAAPASPLVDDGGFGHLGRAARLDAPARAIGGRRVVFEQRSNRQGLHRLRHRVLQGRNKNGTRNK
jgi:hypothetical protein